MFLPISTFVYDMLQEILDIFNEIDLYIKVMWNLSYLLSKPRAK